MNKKVSELQGLAIQSRSRLLRMLRYAWAFPYTLGGLLMLLLALPSGATVRIVDGSLEVAGGWIGAWGDRLPRFLQFYAITLGHVILGVDHASLLAHRMHEQVHVRQYERWGILFIPLYCCSSIVQFLCGRDPYSENRFEREACLPAYNPSRQLGHVSDDSARIDRENNP